MATPTQLQSLKLALSFDRPPLCGGAISPPPEGLYLYYGKKDPRFIDFASVTSEELDLLLDACEPVPSCRGNEGVYRKPYRNASKLGGPDFAVQLDLVSSGLMRSVEDKLLQHELENKCLRAEVYGLNVYDTGSFLKVNEGSPRSTDAVGSLVVIFPTPHEGGELVLHRKGHEWKFNANTLTASRSSSSLAYVAFYGDIEHEILPVTAGRVVTVTYDLYFVEPSPKPGVAAEGENAQSDSNLQDTLKRLLKSPEFLPSGGTLGFGLAHLYPVKPGMDMKKMERRLKGEDAHVYRACRELRLDSLLKIIYDDTRSGGEHGIMVDEIDWVEYSHEDETFETGLLLNHRGVLVNKTEDADPHESGLFDKSKPEWDSDDEEGGTRVEFITWVSPFNARNKSEDYTVSLGNDVAVDTIYCSPCIIARIAPASDRM